MTLFAENARRIMSEKGITHQQLADAIDCHRPSVTRALRGTYNPSLEFVEAVADALDVNVRNLFDPIREKVAV